MSECHVFMEFDLEDRPRIKVEVLPRKRLQRSKYQLMASYTRGCQEVPIIVRVPSGFVTDFATIPRFLTWLYPPDGPWVGAAIVHDYMYYTGVRSRELADYVLYRLMLQDGIPKKRARVFYVGVRAFGWYAWFRKRRSRR